MKNATEPKGLSRRVLALVTALLLTLSLLPGSFAVSAEETASDTFYVDGSAAASGDGLTPETAVKTLSEGYALLDKAAGGKLVLSGPVEGGGFDAAGSAVTGPVTITGTETGTLTLTGNKLKCFQIFILDDFSDELLFELGTLSPVGCVADHKHEYSPSQEYYDRIIRTHTISAFRNWKALALVDSFTVVAKGRTAAQMWVWPNSYFRLIYIHALYQKTLLFVVNRQFRSAANDRKSIRLLHKMKEQEHWYAFSNISYNFLPQLIYRAIDTGLDIATEREQLHRHLEQEAERLEKNSERRLAGLILFLTMLTVCSATYDGASLVKDYFGWESGTTPFRIFAALLLSAIVITSISVWHYRRNKS